MTKAKFAVVNESAIGSRELTDREFRVYCALLRFRNSKTHLAWPSREVLAEVLGCNPRSLERPIRSLIRKGWLTPANKPHKGQTAAYRVNDSAIELQQDVVPPEDRATTSGAESYNNGGARATTPCSSLSNQYLTNIKPSPPLTPPRGDGRGKIEFETPNANTMTTFLMGLGIPDENLMDISKRCLELISEAAGSGKPINDWKSYSAKVAKNRMEEISSTRGRSLQDDLTDTSWAR